MVVYPYWIEHDENGNPINYVWVKVDNIPAGSTIKIYAKKISGYSPNGDSTFDFFDDFDGTSLDTNKWINSQGSPSVSNSILTYSQSTGWGNGGLISNTFLFDLSKGYILSYLGKTTTYEALRACAGDSVGLYYKDSCFVIHGSSSFKIHFTCAASDTYETIFGSYNTGNNVWYIVEGIRYPSNTFKYNLFSSSGNLLDSFSGTIRYPNLAYNNLVLEGYDDWAMDWVYVRKYTANEPTISVIKVTSDTYEIQITNNETTDLTDYQIAVPINDLQITSTTESIQFSNEKPELIYSYWIEHDENGNPINNVWIKIDSIPASSTKTIYVKKEAGFTPNGDDVFEFFDDFEGTSIDTGKWTIFKQSGGTYSVIDSEIELNPQDNAINAVALRSNTQFTNDFIIETALRTNTDTYWDIGITTTSSILTNSWHSVEVDNLGYYLTVQTLTSTGPSMHKRISGSFTTLCTYQDTSGYYSGSYNVGAETLLRMYYTNSGYLKTEMEYLSGTQFAHLEATDTTYLTDNKYVLLWQGEYSNGWGGESWWDWVRVRKYTANEPTVTVTNKGSYYEVNITNNETTDLTNYQVAIPIGSLNIASATESLLITDTSPTKNKSIHFGHNV